MMIVRKVWRMGEKKKKLFLSIFQESLIHPR